MIAYVIIIATKVEHCYHVHSYNNFSLSPSRITSLYSFFNHSTVRKDVNS